MRDERTFIERVSAHAGALRRFAQRLTRNTADAEDVLQDTLVKAMEKRDELRDPGQLRGWLMAIVRTSWLNSRRGLRHKRELLDGDGEGHETTRPGRPGAGDPGNASARRRAAGRAGRSSDRWPRRSGCARWRSSPTTRSPPWSAAPGDGSLTAGAGARGDGLAPGKGNEVMSCDPRWMEILFRLARRGGERGRRSPGPGSTSKDALGAARWSPTSGRCTWRLRLCGRSRHRVPLPGPRVARRRGGTGDGWWRARSRPRSCSRSGARTGTEPRSPTSWKPGTSPPSRGARLASSPPRTRRRFVRGSPPISGTTWRSPWSPERDCSGRAVAACTVD